MVAMTSAKRCWRCARDRPSAAAGCGLPFPCRVEARQNGKDGSGRRRSRAHEAKQPPKRPKKHRPMVSTAIAIPLNAMPVTYADTNLHLHSFLVGEGEAPHWRTARGASPWGACRRIVGCPTQSPQRAMGLTCFLGPSARTPGLRPCTQSPPLRPTPVCSRPAPTSPTPPLPPGPSRQTPHPPVPACAPPHREGDSSSSGGSLRPTIFRTGSSRAQGLDAIRPLSAPIGPQDLGMERREVCTGAGRPRAVHHLQEAPSARGSGPLPQCGAVRACLPRVPLPRTNADAQYASGHCAHSTPAAATDRSGGGTAGDGTAAGPAPRATTLRPVPSTPARAAGGVARAGPAARHTAFALRPAKSARGEGDTLQWPIDEHQLADLTLSRRTSVVREARGTCARPLQDASRRSPAVPMPSGKDPRHINPRSEATETESPSCHKPADGVEVRVTVLDPTVVSGGTWRPSPALHDRTVRHRCASGTTTATGPHPNHTSAWMGATRSKWESCSAPGSCAAPAAAAPARAGPASRPRRDSGVALPLCSASGHCGGGAGEARAPSCPGPGPCSAPGPCGTAMNAPLGVCRQRQTFGAGSEGHCTGVCRDSVTMRQAPVQLRERHGDGVPREWTGLSCGH